MITIKGCIFTYDMYFRIHLIPDLESLKILNEISGEMTRKKIEISPVKGDKVLIKTNDKTFAYMDGIQEKNFKNLSGKNVIIECEVCEYNFSGKKGWYIKCYSIRN